MGNFDTIEVELPELEVRSPSPAAPASGIEGASTSAVDEPQTRLPRRNLQLMSISAAAVALLGGVAYLTAQPISSSALGTHTRSGTAPDAQVSELAAEVPPLRFANPFDAEEVFEFPAGTSEDAARDAVAEILMQRARERQTAKQAAGSKGSPPVSRTKDKRSP